MAAARTIDESRAASLPMFKNVDLHVALNKWRLSQNPPLSANAAIEELLLRALAAEGTAVRSRNATPAFDAEVDALVEQFRVIMPRNPPKPTL